jgi:serine protease Do
MRNLCSRNSTFCQVAWVVLSLIVIVPIVDAKANDELLRLKKVQAKVQAVVSRVMPACVAISDGMGAGSGVIISADGLILTAGHVITESEIYEVILPSGQTIRAKALGKNLDIDAGMLQVINPDAVQLPFVQIERNKSLTTGQWVVSLGHSGGYEIGRTPPVRTGRVLRLSPEQVITDAVLIGGDSGGPLFNLDGKLVGIHSSIGDSVAENRHVTIPAFDRNWARMKAGETWGELPELDEPKPPTKPTRRGIIGVRVDLKAPDCKIRIVNPGSPAAEAGILPGDIVATFENVQIIDGRHLIDVIKRYRSGDVCTLTIFRNSKKLEFELQLK